MTAERYRLVWMMCVPGDEWREYEREGDLDDLSDQLRGLRAQMGEGEPIRQPRIERALIAEWEPFEVTS